MKLVLFINSLTGGGAERVLTKLANHWSRTGHDVILATLAEISSDVYATDPTIKRVSLHASGIARNPLFALRNNLTRIIRLRRLLKNEQPDCVVAFMSTANVLAIFAATGTGIPVVGSERTHLHNAGLPLTRQLTQRLTYRYASTIVALTDQSGQWIRDNLRCHVTIIPNSISLPLPCADPMEDPNARFDVHVKLVLCVGRLVREKLMRHLVEIFANVEPDDGWRLVIIGAVGPEQAITEQSIREFAIADKVVHIEHVGNIQQWYERAAIYAMTSQHEGFPNALLEAMGCGCPAIAYDCATGPAELIRDGENGYLVELYDQDTFVQRLRGLMSDAELRERLGCAAREVLHDFSDERSFSMWTSVLQRAVAT